MRIQIVRLDLIRTIRLGAFESGDIVLFTDISSAPRIRPRA